MLTSLRVVLCPPRAFLASSRYAEARALHEKIATEMTSNPVLRVVVAMEAALADHR